MKVDSGTHVVSADLRTEEMLDDSAAVLVLANPGTGETLAGVAKPPGSWTAEALVRWEA